MQYALFMSHGWLFSLDVQRALTVGVVLCSIVAQTASEFMLSCVVPCTWLHSSYCWRMPVVNLPCPVQLIVTVVALAAHILETNPSGRFYAYVVADELGDMKSLGKSSQIRPS